MKRKLWIVVPALAGAAMLASCSDKDQVAGPGQDSLLQQLIQMGARPDQIEDRGDHFVVEGDIRINKADLRASAPGRPSYQRYDSPVSSSRTVIRVDLSAVDAANASWASATRHAMNNWSSISQSSVVFIEGTPADITVGMVNDLGDCAVAQGTFPAAGVPGGTISISRRYLGSYSFSRQIWIMTHEFGHNVGLAHTDGTFGTLIPGTPASDPGSVMNSGNTYGGCPPNAPDWSWFNQYDQLAMQTLYPLPAPAGVSISYPGGTPSITWQPVAGASYYRVRLYQHSRWYSPEYGSHTTEGYTEVGTTTGTSMTDPQQTYSGASSCYFYYPDANEEEYRDYWYSVEAVFPYKYTSTQVAAEVCPAS